MTTSEPPPGANAGAQTARFSIEVPGSSSNLGPGFDVLGLALSIWLRLDVEVDGSASEASDAPILTYTGEGADSVPLAWEKNLITHTAAYVLAAERPAASVGPLFPRGTTVRVSNQIPLGRGLGSSGAAVVAGVLLANELGELGLLRERVLDYCLTIEGHPDNVTAATAGGFVASYLRDVSREFLDTLVADRRPPPPSIVRLVRLGWAPEIKAVVVVPDFQVATVRARAALLDAYPRADVVFNLQRLAVLTTGLGRSPPDAELIFNAMADRVHQPHRMHLVSFLWEKKNKN
ncbi:MAG: ribosomal protein S5 domain 2-type protein [Olpidium bornovanus]|uniref:Homoserine kinase n=1 Tax=Olpidium bornovanus TaxID=278681 RepID=A0A8H8DM92_9FUNG|nr:MAG: ribosomal protein S5 domain 2-type protein [Olpidium bornovanus]